MTLPVDDLSPEALSGSTPTPATPAPAQTPAAPAEAVTIDWSKVDPKSIPESVIKANPTYANVLTESIQRRQELKALKDQQAAPKPADNAQPQQQGTNDALVKQLAEMQAQIKTLSEKADRSSRQGLIDAAVEAHNLPAGAAAWITGTTPDEIKAQAAELSKTFLTPNAGGSTGGGSVATAQDKIRAAIKARIQGTTGPIDPVEGSLFNPSVQDRIS